MTITMTKRSLLAAFMLPMLFGAYLLLAQEEGARQNPPQRHPLTFFVTSAGIGKGGDLGGLAGADAHCQALAATVAAGNHTWHAYLSTQARGAQPAVNARDRIGQGPWHNSKGAAIAQDLSDLHGDTLQEARLGSNLFKQSALNEKGQVVNGAGDTPNTHDMLTGSLPDGRAYTDSADHTCNNWTSSSTGSAQVGHSDRIGNGSSWNSSNATKGCSQADLESTGGTGLFYCFATN